MKVGILPLGRPTFDVPFANEKLDAMLGALSDTGNEIVGPRELLFDAEATGEAIEELKQHDIDRLLLLQVTFTDASMSIEAASAFDVPLSIWATPEPRLGGRLRLNAFCGLNLASHAFSLNEKRFSWAYCDVDSSAYQKLVAMLSGNEEVERLDGKHVKGPETIQAKEVVERVSQKRIGRIGDHPVGFDTCAYSPERLKNLAGVSVDEILLDELFDNAHKVSKPAMDAVRAQAQHALTGLANVDQSELDKSLRLKVALDQIQINGGYDAFAIRCWPETFTQYGGAVCGPASMLGEAKIPCACEADVYGALTQLILQEASGQPVFLADLVDMDPKDNTGVVWHCGQAPVSMRDPQIEAQATIHTNRKMPLLFEFPLKPGRVTFMRMSQAYGKQKMVITKGEILERPMAFTGTSGVVRFDREVADILPDLMASGVEHHMALAYGDHSSLLRSIATTMNIPVLEL